MTQAANAAQMPARFHVVVRAGHPRFSIEDRAERRIVEDDLTRPEAREIVKERNRGS